jgi:polysaccharide biosynthesis transport protein
MGNGQQEFESRFGRYLVEEMGSKAGLLSRRHVDPAPWAQAERGGELPAHHDLLDYWRIFRVRKFMILGFVVAGLVIALMFSLHQRPVYRAHTSIDIQDLNENFLNLKEDPTSRNPAAGPSDPYFQTQIQILHSESLLKRVIDKPSIAQALAQQGSKGQWLNWRKHVADPKNQPPANQEQLIEQVASQLTVRSSGETRLVDVYFDAPDPQLAADFANTLISEFVEQSHEMRWQSTQQTAE